MDRLTKRMPGISHSLCGNVIYAKCENCTDRKPECYGEDCPVMIEALLKLAAFEDTGFSPAEFVYWMNYAKGMSKDLRLMYGDTSVQRLMELAKADREGRCVVLPCKVGDTVPGGSAYIHREAALAALKERAGDADATD